MDIDQLLRGLLALVFVLGLIGGLAILAKRFGFTPRVTKSTPSAKRRLSLLEVLPVDAKRRLVLVRSDDREHLILLGSDRDLVVEAGQRQTDKKENDVLPDLSSTDSKSYFWRRSN